MKLPSQFQFSRQCQATGCAKPSLYYPEIVLYTFLGDSFPIVLRLAVCEEHKSMLTEKDLISDEIWNNYLTKVTNVFYKTPPIREYTKIRICLIPKENFEDKK